MYNILVQGGIVHALFYHEKGFFVSFLRYKWEEGLKLDTFLLILEKSGVASIIRKAISKDTGSGRKPYNPHRLFASIVYGFSKHSGSVRLLEESLKFDLRFIYLMEQERPSYVTISKFLNNIVVPCLN